VTAGQSASTTETAFTVAGLGAYQLVTSVSVSKLPEVAVGQVATVVPDGSTSAIAGKVVSIGLVPTTTGSSTTYEMVIGLTEPSSGLHSGAAASARAMISAVVCANTLVETASTPKTIGTMRLIGDLQFRYLGLPYLASASRKYVKRRRRDSRTVSRGQDAVYRDAAERDLSSFCRPRAAVRARSSGRVRPKTKRHALMKLNPANPRATLQPPSCIN